MEHLYENLLNHLSIGAAIMSPDGRTIFMNDAYRQQIGEKESYIYSADLASPRYLKKLSTSLYLRVMA